MLSFYLAFLYANRPYYDPERLLCMSEYLFIVQSKNRLKQKGLLKRFTTNCYGKQETMEDIRASKANKFKELQNKRNSKEYEEYFLRYTPGEVNRKKKHATTKRVLKKTRGKSGAKKASSKTRRTGISKLKNRFGFKVF